MTGITLELALACALAAGLAFAADTGAKPSEKPAATLTPLSEFESQTFVLKYAKASEVADSINRLCRQLGVRESAVAFPESHTVVVAAPPRALAQCAKIVREVDRKPKQVYVEARFLDLLVSDREKFGVTWNVLNDLTVGGAVEGGYTLTRTDGQRTEGSTLNAILSASDLQVVLNAIRLNNDDRMFANPRVVVASGKTASVDITTKRPNVNVSAKRTVDGNNNSMDIDSKLAVIPGKDKLMFADEAFFWWGVGLRVEPYVAEDGIITAKIVPNVSDLSDESTQTEGAYVEVKTSDDEDMPTSKFPIVDVKRIETEFSLKSGETAVIGGLSKTEVQDIETGIPYLWKIPFIGPYLFGSTQKLRRQREIVVLVTMGLVDPEKPDKKAGLPKNAVISREYVEGRRKEPGDRTREELVRMYRQNEKPDYGDIESDGADASPAEAPKRE